MDSDVRALRVALGPVPSDAALSGLLDEAGGDVERAVNNFFDRMSSAQDTPATRSERLGETLPLIL
jgi:hypothetical protein